MSSQSKLDRLEESRPAKLQLWLASPQLGFLLLGPEPEQGEYSLLWPVLDSDTIQDSAAWIQVLSPPNHANGWFLLVLVGLLHRQPTCKKLQVVLAIYFWCNLAAILTNKWIIFLFPSFLSPKSEDLCQWLNCPICLWGNCPFVNFPRHSIVAICCNLNSN